MRAPAELIQQFAAQVVLILREEPDPKWWIGELIAKADNEDLIVDPSFVDRTNLENLVQTLLLENPYAVYWMKLRLATFPDPKTMEEPCNLVDALGCGII